MPDQIILTEKLRRPEVTGLPRPRLEKPVLAAPSGELVLVVAPPGSGKTTLLNRVCATAAFATTWYRVTVEDSSEAAFTSYLGRTLQDGLGAGPGPVDRMDTLLAGLDGWDTDGLVVLDDLHEIAGTPAESALSQFVSLRPPRIRVVIGSRRQPGINIPRLRVSGGLREITSDDLRFRSWEVEELFVGLFREPLAPEAAAALTRRTGGWAAGLQLFHLSTRTRSPLERAQAVADLGGRSKLIRSYLARNVLAELPVDRREFLLHTSTLGLLTGPLCDVLLGTTGSGRVLDELEHQQLFTSSADDGRTFRYHEVLRAHLEAALVEEYGVEGARSWYSRSAALLESADERQAAVRAYARAEDWGSVTRLIQIDQGGSVSTATAVADLLPQGVIEHDPWLALVDARRRLRNGSVQAAADAFRRARNLLDEPGFRERCEQERAVALLWLPHPPPIPRATGESAAYGWAASVRAATRRTAEQSSVGRANPGSAAQRLASGISSLLLGEVRWAAVALDQVAADGRADQSLRLAARFATVITDLATGTSGDLPGTLAEIAVEAETDGFPWIARLARGAGDAVLVAQGAPAWRTAALEDLLMSCEEAGDLWGAALLQLGVGVAGVVGGEPTARTSLLAASSRFAALDAPVLQCWADCLAALDAAVRQAPGAVAGARRAADHAAAQEVRGAHALALAALALADPGDRSAAIEADELAGACGLRTAILALTEPPRRVAEIPATFLPPVLPAPRGPEERAATAPVEIGCFGGLQLRVDGKSVDLEALRPRSRSLLRILALSVDQDVHRERLIDLLWPGTEVTVATRRLQVAVSSVRQLLEQAGLPVTHGIVRRGDAYRLSVPPGTRVDVRDFEALLKSATSAATTGEALTMRQRAVALYTGELLPEEGPAEFVAGTRDRLRVAAASAAASVAQDAASIGRDREAAAAARFSIDLDPFQDLPWRLLAELHEAAGDSSAAEQVRRDHARARDELEGVS